MNQNPNYNPYEPNPSNPGIPSTNSSSTPPPPPGPNPNPSPSEPYPYPAANPYNPYPPNLPVPGSNPNLNPYEPYTPNSPTLVSPPNYNPYDPYTPAAPGSNPIYNPYTPIPPAPPPSPSPPRPRPFSGRILALVGAALLVILIAILILAVVLPNQSMQANNAHATATAQVNGTAQARTNMTATAQANAQATAIASTYPFSNKVLLNDPLTDNSHGYKWDEGADNSGGTCTFSGSAYHTIETQSGFFNTCFAANTNFSNFTYQVEMTIIKGDAGGILFRSDSTNSKFYYFRIAEDGSYDLYVYVNTSGSNARTLKSGTASAFNTGLNQTNLIAVVARNDTLNLYVNKQLVTSATNNTYSTGQIGVSAEYFNHTTEVVYTNAEVWAL